VGCCRDWFHSYGLSATLLGLNGHKGSATMAAPINHAWGVMATCRQIFRINYN
jgi:hypothetical protein